jgi:photosystem II stability/assembly factor-like uncharacterized protein
MRIRLVLGAFLAVAVAAAALALSPSHHAVKSSFKREAVASEASELEAPSDAILARDLTGADPGINVGSYFRAATSEAASLDTVGGSWQFLGPTNIGGRVLDIAVDPRPHDSTFAPIYIAAATGGVWKSTDGGSTFSSVWPDDLTQTIGALAIGPDGTLYAGTGEAGPGGGSSTYGGTGLYKSTDGGASWDYIGLRDTSRIGRIVVDPTDPQKIFVAGTGPLYQSAGGQGRGLYESDNGGDTWKRVLRGDNDTTGAVDVAIDPKNPKTVYAAMWDNFRERDKRDYEGLGSGLYKSTDGGTTWARIGTPFFGPNPQIGRIGVAVASDGTVYGNVSGPSGVYSGFYSSSDGGQTWTTGQPPTNPEDSFYVYGWWFGRIYVDPKDPKHVFQGALVLQESKDGGQTWNNAAGSCSNICTNGHADNHAMAWDPTAANRVYLGNDGGVFRSDDDGATWKRFKSLPISQVNGLDVSQQDPTRMVVGLQDNGQNRNWVKSTDHGNPAIFNSYGGGDGQRVSIAPARQNVVYGCYQYGACAVSTDGGTTSNSMGLSTVPELGACEGTRWNWFTPIEFDPANDKTIYTASEAVCVSTDDGQTLTPISPDLSNGPGRETNPLFRNYGTITTIGVGKGGSTLYAGTDDGNLWYTHDSSTPVGWTKSTAPSLPKAWVTKIAVDPNDANHAFVSYSGFRLASDAPYVLETKDGGVNWTDISGNLPNAPVNNVALVGDDVIAATDVGVFVKPLASADWKRLGSGLPLAPAYEVRYAAKTNQLFVGTFGRGVYVLDASVLSSDG